MTTKAWIKPLHGKYYGTEVVIEIDGNRTVVEVWEMGDYRPSTRQLEDWGVTEEQARADDYMCNTHYETALGYKIAQRIAQAFNE